MRYIDPNVGFEAVCKACELAFGIGKDRLLMKDRSEGIAWPRQLAMAAMLDQFGCTSVATGRLFGKDHGTVLHARKMVLERSQFDWKSMKDTKKFLSSLAQVRREVAA